MRIKNFNGNEKRVWHLSTRMCFLINLGTLMQEHWRYSDKTEFHNTKDGTSMQTKDDLEVETNDKCERIVKI
jgi:hypothetical protein